MKETTMTLGDIEGVQHNSRNKSVATRQTAFELRKWSNFNPPKLCDHHIRETSYPFSPHNSRRIKTLFASSAVRKAKTCSEDTIST